MLWRTTRSCRVEKSWLKSASTVPASRLRNASQLAYGEIDAKWQQRWVEQAALQRSKHGPKSYVLPMFAYPSGSLHMGHLRVYTISDVIARYRRMHGYDVLHPTGWDAFGLPAENAAIERGLDPAVWTEENIAKMKAQLKSMNTSFDWDAEVSTCDPTFYKHTQRLFLLLYNRGLAYQADALVNWDPIDKTVLANEQVDSHGKSWRSGAVVQQINLRQWFFRITAFKDALLEDLQFLSENRRWPERVITQQRNWIGKSSGARLRIDVQHPDGAVSQHYIFTTRPDTIFGVKYVAVALSHELSNAYKEQIPALQALSNAASSIDSGTSQGIKLPLRARIPFIGDDFSLPVFAAPYVLEGYGDGAVMGVPAHDSRDLSFWKQHCPAQMIPIVIQDPATTSKDLHVIPDTLQNAYTAPGILTHLCGKYAAMDNVSAAKQIVEDLSNMGHNNSRYAHPHDTWRLRDWLVSRQRYWGAPIPIIHCSSCGTVPVPEKDLPVELPKLHDSMKGQRGNPLEKIPEWVNAPCPRCNQPARRETDTMDTFVDSSWYFCRFTDPQNPGKLFSSTAAEDMLPVDTYVGGVEHAILHLLYARFIYKFLCAEGYVPNHSSDAEPFQQLIAQGMVHGKTFSNPADGRFLKPEEVEGTEDGPLIKASGRIADVSWEKMSKSKYNGVDPTVCIDRYGADATRAHILFAAPVSEVLQWDEEKIVGIQRWFNRVRKIVSDADASSWVSCRSETLPEGTDMSALTDDDVAALLGVHAAITSVTKTFEKEIYGLNTTISDLIKLTNLLYDIGLSNLNSTVGIIAVHALLRMMAPITPAFAEECWERLLTGSEIGLSSSIFNQRWPSAILTADQEAQLRACQKTMTCAVQINGKLRFTAIIPVASEAESKETKPSEERVQEVLDAVLSTETGRIWLKERNAWAQRKRVVLVGGGKLLNVVF